MIFVEKHGSPNFADELVERIYKARAVMFYSDPVPESLFDAINLNHGERYYAKKLNKNLYLVSDGQDTYALTREQMDKIQTALIMCT